METTRALPELGATLLALDEDSLSKDEARAWKVAVTPSPRVCEIASPGDWADLVDAYPLEVTASKRTDWYHTTGRDGRWFIPDWSEVVTEYDAVHFSVHGYLSTPGIAIPLADNDCATVLAGWNPDATRWLDLAAIAVDGDPVEWSWDGDRWLPAPS